MEIYIGADHAGLELKDKLKDHLTDLGHIVYDVGAEQFDPVDDFPDYISLVAEAVSCGGGFLRGIVCGGSGQGEAMLANRYFGVRAAVYYGGDLEIVRLSRAHNNSNVLSFGARFVDDEEAVEAVDLWLATELMDDPKYKRRIEKAEEISVNKNF